MTTVTSLGVGSGLSLETLLTQLMTAESIPLTSLQTKQASYETKISAIGTVTSALATLQTAASGMAASTVEDPMDKFATYAATVADTSIASATASSGATAGSYALTVTQLATSAKMTSDAVSSSSTSLTTSARTLTLNYGGTDYSISLSAGATLSDLSSAINDSSSGVTATIVTGSSGAYLVLNGETGANNTISMDLSSLTSTDGSMGLTETTAAKNAELTLDGIAITSSSNSVTSALDGVTIKLTATTSSATTLTISSDVTSKITSALNTFITDYNSVYSSLSTLTAYNSDTSTAGTLQGDGTMRTVMSQLRKLITTTTSGDSSSAYQVLSNIGVSIQDDGSLKLDSTKLTAALAADPNAVANLVSNIGNAFDDAIDNMTGTSGSITIETTSLNNMVSDNTDQQEKLQLRLDAIEARYRTQFTALDTLIANLNTTSSYITQYLSSTSSSSSSSS
jgi:flagellar hook-associated protein 2